MIFGVYLIVMKITSLQTFKMVAASFVNKRDSKKALPLSRTEHLL